MTAVPPDPNPADTPDLDLEVASLPVRRHRIPRRPQASANPRPARSTRSPPTAAVSGIGLVLFLALFIAAGVLLILNMTGVFD